MVQEKVEALWSVTPLWGKVTPGDRISSDVAAALAAPRGRCEGWRASACGATGASLPLAALAIDISLRRD
jgi:hypothetical protein